MRLMPKTWVSRVCGVFTGQIPRLRAPWAWGGVATGMIAALGSAAPLPAAPGFLDAFAALMIFLPLIVLGLVVFTVWCLVRGKDTLAEVSIKDVPGVRILRKS